MVWACGGRGEKDWMKKFANMYVGGLRSQGRPRKAWDEVVRKRYEGNGID